MREYGFYDSPVMRELERQEIAKNGPDKPIKKAASIEPTDLLSKLANLSKNLRKSGKTEQADRLDYKVAMYVTAAEKNTHLYRTHDEEGEDLIEFAHPDGDVEICPSSGGYGKVETQLSQHKKIVDMVQKEPTGNYATASILEDVAGVLGLKKKAEVDVTVNYNNNIKYVLKQFSDAQNWLDKPNFDWSGAFWTSGIIFDTVGGGLGRNIVVVERGEEVQKGKYVWNIKNEFLYRNVLNGTWPDKTQGTIEDFKESHNNLVNGSQQWFADKLNDQINKVNNLILTPGDGIEKLDYCRKELDRLRGGGNTIESFEESGWKLYFVNNQQMLNTIVDAMWKALEEANYIRLCLSKLDELNKWQSLPEYRQVPYTKPIIGEISKYNVNSAKDLIPEVEAKINEYKLDYPKKKGKKGSVRFGLEKDAQANIDLGPNTPVREGTSDPPPPQKDSTPAVAPAPAPGRTGRTGTRKPMSGKRDITKRIADLTEWQNTHLPEYWQAVQRMQSQLHNLADALKNINASTYALLTGTAIKEFRDQKINPFDGQWGEGTAAALNAAKEELLKLNPDASKIKEGPSSGLMYFAGKDKEKQKQVGRIAEENTRIISEILSKARLSSSTGVASGTVFDYVPKQWTQDLEFMLLNKETGIELKSGDLSDLRSFSNWLNLNQIITNIKADSYEDSRFLNEDSRFLIESLRALKQRADYLVKKQQAPQAYVDAIVALFNKAAKDYNDWIRQNPRKGSPSVSDLEALTGSKSTSKAPGTQGSSGAAGEGMDLQTGESAQAQRQVYELLNDTIYPRHIAQVLPDTNIGRGLVNSLSGSIRRDIIRTLVNNPEGLFDAIINIREDQVTWSRILQVTEYNPNSPALFFNRGGQAVPLQLGNSKGERANATMMQLDSFRNSPPAQRVIREWKLIYVIRALKAIDSDILTIANEIGRNYSDNVALLNKIEDQKVRWVRDINAAIRSAEDSLRGLRTGRGQKNWAW